MVQQGQTKSVLDDRFLQSSGISDSNEARGHQVSPWMGIRQCNHTKFNYKVLTVPGLFSIWINNNPIILLTRYTKDEINKHPPEGVYIHGLFMEGANLDKRTGKLVESRTKILYETMPVIYIYAINTAAGKDSKLYSCPIYRKPIRKDINYVGSVDFESDINPKHWVMRGVALLCDIK